MSTDTIAQQLSRIINPEGPRPTKLTSEDEAFLKQLNEGLTSLADDEASIRTFKNVIRKEGSCGFANGGVLDYLLNTDSGNRYRVTVRTNWRQGIENGQYDSTYISEAGGKQLLGCTDSGFIPVAYYSREVVGEVRI